MRFKVVAIIPARLNSTRYPKKVLIKIKGLTMVEHVRRRAILSKAFEKVYVATCDNEIKKEVEKYGGKVIMTSKKHKTATERVAEAAKKVNCTHVVNVQGDEILIVPEDLKKIVQKIKSSKNINYWNAIGEIKEKNELLSFDVVKCITDLSNNVIYISRAISNLDISKKYKLKKILGIFAYSKKALLNYKKLKKTNAFEFQSLDQSKVIENKFTLKGIHLNNSFPGINTKQEEKMVINILKTNKLQKNILKKTIQS